MFLEFCIPRTEKKEKKKSDGNTPRLRGKKMCSNLNVNADSKNFLVGGSLRCCNSPVCVVCILIFYWREEGEDNDFLLNGFELFFQVTESKTKKMSRKGSTSSTSSSSSSSMMDPLSSVLDGTDPLSLFAAAADPVITTATMVITKNVRELSQLHRKSKMTKPTLDKVYLSHQLDV